MSCSLSFGGHLVYEAVSLSGEFGVALGEKDLAGGAPTAFDLLAGLDEL